MRHLSRMGSLCLLAALVSPVPLASAEEPEAPQEPAPTTLALSATKTYAGRDTTLTVTGLSGGPEPLPQASVRIERRVDGSWRPAGELVTGEDGTVEVERTMSRSSGDNRFRASYDGDEAHASSTSGVVVATLARREGVVRLTGQTTVVDGRRVKLRVLSRTRSGETVRGDVRVLRRLAGKAGGNGKTWREVRTVTTGGKGRARIKVRPRADTRWRVVSLGQDWVRRDRSEVLRIDNLPPVAPVRLPRAAPSPRVHVPQQRRGTGKGAHPVVTGIPDGVWGSMTGRSWHAGCPVGRAGLRLLRINYWGYDGYRHRGELVASVAAMPAMRRALVGMFKAELPIRSMYRVDRFGWSAKLQGADDYRSMAAGNTSAFNCRQVVNRPGVRSPHSYGRSLDVNTWENPYRSPTGLVPNAWWQSHSHPRVAWRSRDHRVVQILTRAGFRWTYGNGDTQHFDVGGGHGRAIAAPPARRCGGAACD